PVTVVLFHVLFSFVLLHHQSLPSFPTRRSSDLFDREGFKVHNARKEVIAGIEEVAKLWKNDRLFYVQGSIPRFEDEIYQYKWKPNSPKDEPLKEYDDELNAQRYEIYRIHKAKIKVN